MYDIITGTVVTFIRKIVLMTTISLLCDYNYKFDYDYDIFYDFFLSVLKDLITRFKRPSVFCRCI